MVLQVRYYLALKLSQREAIQQERLDPTSTQQQNSFTNSIITLWYLTRLCKCDDIVSTYDPTHSSSFCTPKKVTGAHSHTALCSACTPCICTPAPCMRTPTLITHPQTHRLPPLQAQHTFSFLIQRQYYVNISNNQFIIDILTIIQSIVIQYDKYFRQSQYKTL